jgi:hypothetical protein
MKKKEPNSKTIKRTNLSNKQCRYYYLAHKISGTCDCPPGRCWYEEQMAQFDSTMISYEKWYESIKNE